MSSLNECGGGSDRAEWSQGGGGSYVRAAIAVVAGCRSTVVSEVSSYKVRDGSLVNCYVF